MEPYPATTFSSRRAILPPAVSGSPAGTFTSRGHL
jgi:hypothetical protein